MELYNEEIMNIKKAFKELYMKSKELIPYQQQRDEMLEKLAEELFTEKLKKIEQDENSLSYEESKNLLDELKKMANIWINEFNEQENVQEVEGAKRKDSWWKFGFNKK